MNAPFHKCLVQALAHVCSDYNLQVARNLGDLAKASDFVQTAESLMSKLKSQGLISGYGVEAHLVIEHVNPRKALRSHTPADPNVFALKFLSDCMDEFLKEQDQINQAEPDNEWFRHHIKTFVYRTASVMKLYGLIADYKVAGEKCGIVAQSPVYFLTQAQALRFKSGSADASPSP